MNTNLIIDSIEYKFCQKTKEKILKNITPCKNCKNIPLICSKSIQNNQEIHFCKTCCNLQKFAPNVQLINLNRSELNLLENLIINCKYYQEGCKKEFSIKNLEEMIIHQTKCDFKNLLPFIYKDISLTSKEYKHYCPRCQITIYRNKYHDCFKIFQKRIINEYEVLLANKMTELEQKFLQKIDNIYEKFKRILKENQEFETIVNIQKGIIIDQNKKFDTYNSPERDRKSNSNLKTSYSNLSTLTGHSDSVNSLFQLNNEKLISGSCDKTIRIWDLESKKCINILRGHNNHINTITPLFGTNIASGSSDRSIKIWDLTTSQCLRTISLPGSEDKVFSVTRLKDETLASGSSDKTVRIWDIKSGECVQKYEGHKDYVYSVIQLADGSISSGSSDIRIWDLEANKCRQTLTGHDMCVISLIEFNDGKLASGSIDSKIKIWDPSAYIFKCSKTLEGYTDTVSSICQLSNGNLASASFDKTVKIWDVAKEKSTTLKGHNNSVYSIVQLSDGKIASGSLDTIKIWGQ